MESFSFGDKLKNHRTALNLTQAELGKMLNVSQVTVANYERGERFPKQKVLLAIASIFDVSVDSLLVNPKNIVAAPYFPDSYHFDVRTLVEMLISAPIEDSLAYTVSWKSFKNFDLITFYEEIIVPALELTGVLWFKGEILVTEEHLISNKIRELIILHANREYGQNPVTQIKNKRWMGFCAPGEKHELSLLMFSQVLRLAGWTVFYLGTEIPFKELSGMIKKYNPDVLGASITMSENIDGFYLYMHQIKETFGTQLSIIFGGRVADAIHVDDRFSGVFVRSLREGYEISEDLMK